MTRKLFIVVLALAAVASAVVYFVTRPVARGMVLTGVVDADEIAVGSQVQGQIQKLLVEDGQSVAAGQTVALIKPQEPLGADQNYYTSAMKGQREQVGVAAATLRFQELQTRDQIRQAEAALAAAQAQEKQAAANLGLAQLNYKRTHGLFEQGINSAQDDDQARTNLQVAQAGAETAAKQVQVQQAALALAQSNLQQVTMRERELAANRYQFAAAQAQTQAAKVRLDDTEIHAPMAGLVSLRAALEGEVVNPGQPIIVMYDPEKLWVRADVPETYIDRIRLGEELPVRFPGGMARTGTVYFRGVDADYATQRDVSRTKRDIKTFQIRLRVNNQDRRLAPGLTAFVTLPFGEE
jgi:HlyD family secretion protein